MSDALDDLEKQEYLVRHFLEQPSTLSAAKMKALRGKALNAIQVASYMRGFLNGEASGQDEELKSLLQKSHQYYADQLGEPLRHVLSELTRYALPPKRPKAGRPPKTAELDGRYLFVIAAAGSKNMLDCIREAADVGLIDKKIKDTTHLRRIERFMKKYLEHWKKSNVIPGPWPPRDPNKKS